MSIQFEIVEADEIPVKHGKYRPIADALLSNDGVRLKEESVNSVSLRQSLNHYFPDMKVSIVKQDGDLYVTLKSK